MRSKMMFTGVHTAIITPFKQGEIDFGHSSASSNVKSPAASMASYPRPTGESSTLSDEEIIALVQRTLDVVDGRCAVIAGIGTNDTARTIRLAREAQNMGADVVPSSLRTTISQGKRALCALRGRRGRGPKFTDYALQRTGANRGIVYGRYNRSIGCAAKRGCSQRCDSRYGVCCAYRREMRVQSKPSIRR